MTQLDDIAFNARCTQENQARGRAQRREAREKGARQVGQVVGADGKRVLVQRQDGTIETRENFSRAGAGDGQVFALEGTCGNGTQGFDTLEPRRLELEDVIEPIFVRRRRGCNELILTALYCNPFSTFHPASGQTIDSYDCCYLTRDCTEVSARAVALWVADYSGFRTLGRTQGDIRVTCETRTTTSNGGCDGETYQEYSYQVCGAEGVPGEIYITERVSYRLEHLQLGKGDTHILFQERISHRGGSTALDRPFARTDQACYFTNLYVWVPADWTPAGGALGRSGVGRLNYEWTATSWPSMAHQISGSGTKLVSGLEIGKTFTPTVNGFCESPPGLGTYSLDSSGDTPPYTSLDSALIPIMTEPKPDDSYISSAEQKDFAGLTFDQKTMVYPGILNSTLQATTDEDGFFWEYSNDMLDFFTEAGTQGLMLVANTDTGPTAPAASVRRVGRVSPTLIIPDGQPYCEMVYTRDFTVDPIECEFRGYTRGEFDVPDENGILETPPGCRDWRAPINDPTASWFDICHEDYADDTTANIGGNTLYTGSKGQVLEALQKPDGETTEVMFQCQSLTVENGQCVKGEPVLKPFNVSGLGASTEAEMLAIAPNRVKCRYGKKDVIPAE